MTARRAKRRRTSWTRKGKSQHSRVPLGSPLQRVRRGKSSHSKSCADIDKIFIEESIHEEQDTQKRYDMRAKKTHNPKLKKKLEEHIIPEEAEHEKMLTALKAGR